MKKLIFTLVTLACLSTHAGDFENFGKDSGDQAKRWAGLKRKIPQDKARQLREDREAMRSEYLRVYSDQIKHLSEEREMALKLTYDVPLVRVSLQRAEKECLVVENLAKADQCLNYLKAIFSRITNLRLQAIQLSNHSDQQVAANASEALTQINHLEANVHTVFSKWLDNKFAIQRELDRRASVSARERGQKRGDCLSSPVVLQAQLLQMEKDLNDGQAKNELYLVASASERARELLHLADMIAKNCDYDLAAYKKRFTDDLNRANENLNSPKLLAKFRADCADVNSRYQTALNCTATPTLSLLYSVRQLKVKGTK